MSRYDYPGTTRRFRSLFLSDLHLGSRRCHAGKLLAFLQENDADHIYLVGDIFDIWHARAVHWTSDHDLIIELLCERARQGVRIVNLPGNHDPLSQTLHPAHSRLNALFPATPSAIHLTGDGKRLLVVHGDCCDFWPFRSYAVSRLGSLMDWLFNRPPVSRILGQLRSHILIQPFLSPFTRSACAFLLRAQHLMEKRLTKMAVSGGFDGVICGHLHRPVLQPRQGVIYANCGDWVQNMSAVAEDLSGKLSLLERAGQTRCEYLTTGTQISSATQSEGA